MARTMSAAEAERDRRWRLSMVDAKVTHARLTLIAAAGMLDGIDSEAHHSTLLAVTATDDVAEHLKRLRPVAPNG